MFSQVVYGPQVSLFFSASRDRTIKVWERASPHSLNTFTGHDLVVTALSLNDGNPIALPSGFVCDSYLEVFNLLPSVEFEFLSGPVLTRSVHKWPMHVLDPWHFQVTPFLPPDIVKSALWKLSPPVCCSVIWCVHRLSDYLTLHICGYYVFFSAIFLFSIVSERYSYYLFCQKIPSWSVDQETIVWSCGMSPPAQSWESRPFLATWWVTYLSCISMITLLCRYECHLLQMPKFDKILPFS